MLDWITTFFRDMKLRNKIAIIMNIFVIMAIGLTGTLIYNQAAIVIKENVIDQNSEIIDQSAAFFDEKLKGILDQVQFMEVTDSFQEAIESIIKNAEADYESIYINFHILMSRISVNEPFIDSMQIHIKEYVFYDSILRSRPAEIVESDLKYKDMIKGNNSKKTVVQWGNLEVVDHRDGTIPALLSIPDWDENRITEDLNILLKFDASVIANYLDKVGEKSNSEVYIVDKDFKLVFLGSSKEYIKVIEEQEVKDMVSENRKSLTIDNGEVFLITRSIIDLNGWQLIGILKEEDILKDLKNVQDLSVLFIILISISTFFLSILVSRSITTHLKILRNAMMTAKENEFDVKVIISSKNEIGDLGRTFNQMSQEIKTLIDELKKAYHEKMIEQNLKRMAEIKVLNEQMNPHFLYNALDSMYWRSAKNGNMEVANMALALSNLFRIGLNKGREMISLENEIKHVTNYLEIQKIVYTDKFNYTVEVEGEINNIKVIKLILQPLVENSIVHGFAEYHNNGYIKVAIKVLEDYVEYKIIDNGVGFNAKEVMKSIINRDEKYEGYALGNIYNRLILHYGDQLIFEIESIPGRKTEVVVGLPKLLEVEEWND